MPKINATPIRSANELYYGAMFGKWEWKVSRDDAELWIYIRVFDGSEGGTEILMRRERFEQEFKPSAPAPKES